MAQQTLTPRQLVQMFNDPKYNAVALVKALWNQEDDSFLVGLQLSLDSSIPAMAVVPEIEDDDDQPSEFTFSAFQILIRLLSQPNLLATDAKKAINDAAMVANVQEWNLWYRRILLKTLPRHLPMELIQHELARLTTGN